MRANRTRAHVVQSHVVLGPALALRLKRTLTIDNSGGRLRRPQTEVTEVGPQAPIFATQFSGSLSSTSCKITRATHLEEDGLPVLALWTRVILGPRQSGISDDVRDDVGDLVNLVHNLVHVDAVVVRNLFVVAVAARVEQHPVLLILLRVQHVVALLKYIS